MGIVDPSICWEKYGSLLEKTIQWFTRTGPSYREKPWREDFLYKYSRGIGLDLGSGIASTTRELLKEGYLERLVLVDLAHTSLEKVIDHAGKIISIASDILETPFKSSCFDTIYLLAVLHHIPGLECRLLLLKEIYRLLKPRGHLIVTAWSPDQYMLSSIKKLVKINDKEYIVVDQHGERYYYFFDEEELLGLIEKTSFKVVDKGFFTQNPAKPLLTRNIYVVARKPD